MYLKNNINLSKKDELVHLNWLLLLTGFIEIESQRVFYRVVQLSSQKMGSSAFCDFDAVRDHLYLYISTKLALMK